MSQILRFLIILLLIILEQLGLGQNIQNKLASFLFQTKLIAPLKVKEESLPKDKSGLEIFTLETKPLPYLIQDLIDVETSKVLFEKESTKQARPASLSKLMTAIVVLDKAKLEEVVTISPQIMKIEGNSVHFSSGEQVTVENLLYALLMQSSNKAAYALAEHIAGSETEFVKLMNNKASYLGLYNTHFQNPAGFDHQDQYSTAFDLAFLAKYALTYPKISQIIATKEYDFATVGGRHQKLVNSNKLLGQNPYVLGGKTGFTDEAGQCLVTISSKDDHKIISVVLGSKARFAQSNKIINEIYNNYQW